MVVKRYRPYRRIDRGVKEAEGSQAKIRLGFGDRDRSISATQLSYEGETEGLQP